MFIKVILYIYECFIIIKDKLYYFSYLGINLHNRQ